MITALSDKLQAYLLPVANKIAKNRYLQAMKDAFLISVPFTMFGSLVLALANIPYMEKLMGADAVAAFQSAIGPIQNVTFNLIAVMVVLGIGYSLGKHYELNEIYTAICSLAGFLIVTPIVELADGGNGFALNDLGTMSIFTGIIIAILCTEIYRLIVKKNMVIHMPDSVPPMVADSFLSVIPVAVVLLVCFAIQFLFAKTSFGTLNGFVYKMIQVPISKIGTSFPATMLAGALCNLFWFFGLHGNSIVYNSVLSPIFKTMSLENLAAFQAHQSIPHIITEEFAWYFGGFNGSFIAYPILICIFLFFRNKKEWKNLGEVALIPGIFSIYEPIVFGFPLMLNPMLLIPMLLTPAVSCAIGYIFMYTGICPPCTGVSVPWTTPMILSGIITTNSLMGGVVQLITIVALTALWYVFLKMLYKQDEKAVVK